MTQTKNYQGNKVTYPRYTAVLKLDTGAYPHRITAAGNRFTEPTPPPRSPLVYTLAYRKAWKDLVDDNSSESK